MKSNSRERSITTKILFVCPTFSSFIQNDLDILRRHFNVRVAYYQGKKRMLKFLIETLKGVLWTDLTFFGLPMFTLSWRFCSCQSYLNSDAKSKV